MTITRRRLSQGVALSVLLAPALWLFPAPAWVFPREPLTAEQRLARRIAALMAASRELSSGWLLAATEARVCALVAALD